MSFRSLAIAFVFCFFFGALPAQAGLADIVSCWIPIFLGGHTQLERRHPSINSNTIEDPLREQAEQFLSQQEAISEISRHHFSKGMKLRELLLRSREVLTGVVREFSVASEHFQRNFGKDRQHFTTLVFFGSARLPTLSQDRMRFLYEINRSKVQQRIRAEAAGRLPSENPGAFPELVLAARAAHYHTLDHRILTPLFCFMGGAEDTGDDNYYVSFPDRQIIDVVLEDAENRLELARTSPYPKRREHFLAALYGYVISHPYLAGNQTIGWPVFAGVYLDLMEEPLPAMFGRDDLIRLSTLSQGWFIEHVGQAIDSRQPR